MPCRFVSGKESAKTVSRVEAAVVSLFHVRNRTFQAARISEPGGTMVTYPRGGDLSAYHAIPGLWSGMGLVSGDLVVDER